MLNIGLITLHFGDFRPSTLYFEDFVKLWALLFIFLMLLLGSFVVLFVPLVGVIRPLVSVVAPLVAVLLPPISLLLPPHVPLLPPHAALSVPISPPLIAPSGRYAPTGLLIVAI